MLGQSFTFALSVNNMTKTTKALLLSALVFPGCGQLHLKRYGIAAILISITLVCTYILLSSAVDIANEISAQIMRGELALDVQQISDAISSALSQNNQQTITLCTWLLGISWVIGIADIWHASQQPQPLGNSHE